MVVLSIVQRERNSTVLFVWVTFVYIDVESNLESLKFKSNFSLNLK